MRQFSRAHREARARLAEELKHHGIYNPRGLTKLSENEMAELTNKLRDLREKHNLTLLDLLDKGEILHLSMAPGYPVESPRSRLARKMGDRGLIELIDHLLEKKIEEEAKRIQDLFLTMRAGHVDLEKLKRILKEHGLPHAEALRLMLATNQEEVKKYFGEREQAIKFKSVEDLLHFLKNEAHVIEIEEGKEIKRLFHEYANEWFGAPTLVELEERIKELRKMVTEKRKIKDHLLDLQRKLEGIGIDNKTINKLLEDNNNRLKEIESELKSLEKQLEKLTEKYKNVKKIGGGWEEIIREYFPREHPIFRKGIKEEHLPLFLQQLQIALMEAYNKNKKKGAEKAFREKMLELWREGKREEIGAEGRTEEKNERTARVKELLGRVRKISARVRRRRKKKSG